MFGQAQAISDICMFCRDLEVSIEFYRDKLNFKPRRRAEGFADFETEGVIVALWEMSHFAKHVGYADTDSKPPAHKAMTAIALENCEVVDKIYNDLLAKGVVFINAPKAYPWNAYCAYFHDPDNNLWELYARMGDPDDYHESA